MESHYIDEDPEETREWLEALDGVVGTEGVEKARYLLSELGSRAQQSGVTLPFDATTPYANTIPPSSSAKIPSKSLVARNVAAYVRWNAMAMVARANQNHHGIGGHIASFASSAVLYEVGFNWFFRGPSAPGGADLVYFQGHSAPGVYARAYVEGRLSDQDLENFRREAGGKGLSSYPHPWLMKDFWEFPTVSMGLGPLSSMYQARFMKYMNARSLAPAGDRKVWAFIGDGETDEPETRGAISLAAREKLDNLIYVINCNLQRLDGPVRGNGKIVQELEGQFRGAGWNVIKVIWGSEWDKLLEKDTEGLVVRALGDMVDGKMQAAGARDGSWIREHVFGSDPRLAELVKDMSDSDLRQMARGGHDPRKVYAAYAQAAAHRGQPTVILVQTVKGYGMGKSGESANIAHSQKVMDLESLKEFRNRFHVPLKDDELESLPFIRPAPGSEEDIFIRETRTALGGSIPSRRGKIGPAPVPEIDKFASLLAGSDGKEMSTTMGFVRFISALTRDPLIGKQVVPIVADEARTFGMEGLFRQLGIYAPSGQLYEPEDASSLMWYREDKAGQVLEEGITEAGSMASWTAAGTAYANYGVHMIPFYIYYSMFGFQRIGDSAWAAGDSRTRGFLLGATSGRTTLNGEGLQHEDGQSMLTASLIPNCVSFDPSYVYELVTIIQDGMRRMYVEEEDVYYYISLLNENYPQPPMPEGVREGILKGMYLLPPVREEARSPTPSGTSLRVQLMGSGAILNEVRAAALLLAQDFGIESDVWSVPGVNLLHREAVEVERWNRFHPGEPRRVPFMTSLLSGRKGICVFATDYVRAYPEQIRRLVPMPLTILGTDGFGRSDTREKLREFFEVDRRHVALAAIEALVADGSLSVDAHVQALALYGIDPSKPNPMSV